MTRRRADLVSEWIAIWIAAQQRNGDRLVLVGLRREIAGRRRGIAPVDDDLGRIALTVAVAGGDVKEIGQTRLESADAGRSQVSDSDVIGGGTAAGSVIHVVAGYIQ